MSSLYYFSLYLRDSIQDDAVRAQAASLTFTTLFAVVPLMTVTYAVISMFPVLDRQRDILSQFLFRHFVPESANQVMSYLAGFSEQATMLTAPGAIMLILTTVLLLVSIEKSFNHIWQIPEGRTGPRRLLLYWTVLSLGPLLLTTAAIVSTYLSTLPYLSSAAQVFDKPIAGLSMLPMAISILALALIYTSVPNCKVPVKHALLAATLVSLAFTGWKNLFGTMVILSPKYEIIYGAFAAVPLFLLWLYISWYLVLLGVELTFALTHFEHRKQSGGHPLFVLLVTLHLFWQKYQTGQSLSDANILDHLPMLSVSQWAELRQVLLQNQLIVETADKNLVLKRALAQVSLLELYRIYPWELPNSLELNDFRNNFSTLSASPWLEPLLQLIEHSSVSFKQQMNRNLAEFFLQGQTSQPSDTAKIIRVVPPKK